MSVSRVLQALQRHAYARPGHPAVETFGQVVDYAELHAQVIQMAACLRRDGVGRVALWMDNGPAIVAADLAALRAGCVCVPVPLFFSPAQVSHLLRQVGVDLLITDQPEALSTLLSKIGVASRAKRLSPLMRIHVFRISVGEGATLPRGCAKITYTSGSTGEPKGVCLDQALMERVASSLLEAARATKADRHLSMLPFATLLENIGGVYASLLNGSSLVMPPLRQCGLQGSSSLDVEAFVRALHRARATSCILIPQMLQALIAAIDAGMRSPPHLRHVAVGGAPVAPALLRKAEALGVPVFEGYGLSEAASVVAVNTPSARRIGSVGRPLPHLRLRLAEDGEILIADACFLGYLGEPPREPGEWLATGDVGRLDADGFLHLQGRKKHMFISSFGRNISPEWVERELLLEPEIAQACVFGEARPFLVAVLVPGADGDIAQAVARANRRLPDYARVRRWVVADTPFLVSNGQWTGTGRPRRRRIEADYAQRLRELYDT